MFRSLNFPTVRIFKIQVLRNVKHPSSQISKILYFQFRKFSNFPISSKPITNTPRRNYFRLVSLSFRSLKKRKKKERGKKISMGSVKVQNSSIVARGKQRFSDSSSSLFVFNVRVVATSYCPRKLHFTRVSYRCANSTI